MSVFSKNPNAKSLTSNGWSITGTPQITMSDEAFVGSGTQAGLTDIDSRPTALANGNVAYAWRTYDANDTLFVKLMHEDDEVHEAVILGDDSIYDDAPRIVGFADSSFAAIWSERESGLPPGQTDINIKMQRFQADGTPTGSVETVNQNLTGAQTSPTVTELVGGGFVVTWRSSSIAGTDIVMRHFNAQGVPQNEKTLTNDGMETAPEITALADGGWVIAWTLEDSGSGKEARAQMFNPDGTTQGTVIALNTTSVGDQSRPVISGLENGGFVAVWQVGQPDGSIHPVWKMFDANGAATTQEIEIPVSADSVRATALPNGCFIFVWNAADADEDGVYMQAYAPDGSLIGQTVLVNQTTAGNQAYPNVVALPDGGWTISWEGKGAGDDFGIFSRTFHFADVAPVGQDSAFSVASGAAHTFSLADFPYFDLGSNGLEAVRIMTLPANGTLTFKGQPVVQGDIIGAHELADLKYTPSGQLGTASFTFVLRDQGLDGSDTDAVARTMSITIDGANPPPNQPPVLTGPKANLAAVAEDGSVTLTAAQLLQGFTDANQDTLSVTNLMAANASVTATGTGFVIKPNADWNGTLQLSYSVTDGKASVAATQSLVVTPVADVAKIGGTLKATIGEDQAGTVGGTLSVTDPDTGEAGFQAAAAGDLKTAHGTFTFNKDSGTWTFDVDETLASVQALKAGETLVDKLTVKSIDGTSATLEANINGADEPALIPFPGSDGRDQLTGTSANETFDPMKGNDRMTGGGGQDVFVFKGKFGKDRITDFEAASGSEHDVLDLSAIKAITDFNDLMNNHVKDVKAGLKIEVGDHSILLLGVEKADLTNDDVLI